MIPHQPSSPHRRLAIGLALMAVLIAVYLITYNGFAISRDEWFLFDATESFARRGNLEQNLQYDAYLPLSVVEVEPRVVDSEPLQPVLAAPLFLIAQALPGIGLAHTVWVFNIVITALTAGTVYLYGLGLDYRARVAALVALAFGLGTIAWPYSSTFFREPLFTWLALSSAYLMMRLRRQLTTDARPYVTFVLFGLAVAGALFSKEAALLIVPVLLVEAAPARMGRFRLTRRMLVILVALGLLAALLAIAILNLDTWFGLRRGRYEIVDRIITARDNISQMDDGVRGYLFSPSRGIWFYSPVLILGFFGLPRLIRRRRLRQIAAPLVMLVTFVAVYAAVRGPTQWYGGLGWGARYMIPVTPFLALWLLPVFESLLEQGTVWWQRALAGAILAISIGTQILAALVPIQYYSDYLNSNQIIPWKSGAWNWRWSPWRVYPDLLGDVTPAIAWRHAVGSAWLLPVMSGTLALLALGWLAWWVLRSNRTEALRRPLALTMGSLALGVILTVGVSLIAIREDPRYSGNFQPTRDLLAQLEANVRPGDVILLNDFTYQYFFMNYYKLREPVIYTLPPSPGERSNPDQPLPIASPDPDDWIRPEHTLILNYYAQKHDRLWLVINSSRFVTFTLRPIERYLTRHYFPVQELTPDNTARAILFDTTSAPPAPAPLWPENPVNATFGESLQLVGHDLPAGTTFAPGDVVPVSLLWEAFAPVPQDYTVGLFITAGGLPIAEHNTFPVNYFEQTSAWRPGSLHRDNHGLVIPASAPPGEYELWVLLYYWETPADRLPVYGAAGRNRGDYVVLDTITVE